MTVKVEEESDLQAVLLAMTNQWANGKWTWWCRNPPGGPKRETREEAMQDFIQWCHKFAKKEKAKSLPMAQP